MEWDAFKNVIRGQCIANNMGVRRVLLQDLERADQALREVEKERPEHPDRQEELVDAREEVAVQVERLRCFDFKRYVARAHAERDRSGTLLAWLANLARRGTVILELHAPDGEICYTQRGINDQFLAYYTDLYQSKVTPNEEAIREFLGMADLPALDRERAELLGQDITIGEVRGAIKHMARGKTPGVVGLPVEFYSTYIDLLAPRLVALYNTARRERLCLLLPEK